jgi:hypothetical protein
MEAPCLMIATLSLVAIWMARSVSEGASLAPSHFVDTPHRPQEEEEKRRAIASPLSNILRLLA